MRSASVAQRSVGSASASSKPFVCRLWAPPQTAESACTATRTMLFSGCWAVSVEPPVWAWKRSICERGVAGAEAVAHDLGPQRRAARNLATSWKKSLWALKKNESRRANASTSSPASTAAWT